MLTFCRFVRGVLAFASITVLNLFLMMGCSSNSEMITIGAVLPLSGSNAQYGEAARRGIELAIRDYSTRQTSRKKIEVVFEDSQSIPATAVTSLQKLIAVDRPVAVIGEMASSATLAMSHVAQEKRTILISPASSSPELTGAGDFIFRTCVSDSYEASYLADFIKRRELCSSVAVVRINNDYGKGVQTVFVSNYVDSIHTIVSVQPFEADATDFRTILAKVAESHPSCILLVGYKEMIPALVQMKEMGLNLQVISTVMFDDSEILRRAAGPAQGTIFTTWRADTTTTSTEQFRNDYTKVYGTSPAVFSAEAYDAAMLLFKAIDSVGARSDQIRDWLMAVSEYPGASGLISFNRDGDVEKPLVVMIVKDSAFVSITDQ